MFWNYGEGQISSYTSTCTNTLNIEEEKRRMIERAAEAGFTGEPSTCTVEPIREKKDGKKK